MKYVSVLILCCFLVGRSSAFSSISSTTKGGSSFWTSTDPQRVLTDPPPDRILEKIREQPYRGGFEPAVDLEKPKLVRITSGAIPKDLVGTLAVNGAGRIRIGERIYGHWFDGDGYVTVLSMDGSKNLAVFNAKYVRTERFKKQEALMNKLRNKKDQQTSRNPPLASAGGWTFAGRGRWIENIFKLPTNCANTNVLWLSAKGPGETPRLFAVCEGGDPVEMQTSTLESYAEQPFSNEVETVRSFYSAHYCINPFNNTEIFNHGLLMGTSPRLNLFKTDNLGRLLEQLSFQLPYDCFVHDGMVSKSLFCYMTNPYLIEPRDKLKFLFGKAPIGKLYKIDYEKVSYLNLHSKQDLSLKFSIPLPNKMSIYHLIDACEEETKGENGDVETIFRLLVADLDPDRDKLEWQFSNQYFVPDGTRLFSKLTEYSFRLRPNGTYTVLEAGRLVAPDAGGFELPTVNQQFAPDKRRQYCWTNAKTDSDADWMNGIQKIDMEAGRVANTWAPGPGRYAGAPTFCERSSSSKSEDDGYLVSYVYDSNKHSSSAVILDAADLSILCEMELDFFVPYNFHGAFIHGFLANTADQ